MNSLFLATIENKYDLVDLLLANGTTLDKQNPEYLYCMSIQCLKVYLDYEIDINSSDEKQHTLLHHLVALDNPELFEYALKKGCTIARDHQGHTPYKKACIEHKNTLVQYIRDQHPDHIINSIQYHATDSFTFKDMIYLEECPTHPNTFIALTNELLIVKFIQQEEDLRVDRIVEMDLPLETKNISFDKNGNILVPTGGKITVVLDPVYLQVINKI